MLYPGHPAKTRLIETVILPQDRFATRKHLCRHTQGLLERHVSIPGIFDPADPPHLGLVPPVPPHPGPLPLGGGEGEAPVAPRQTAILPLPRRGGEGRGEGAEGGTVQIRPQPLERDRISGATHEPSLCIRN